jgi:hypothetical protein
MRINEAGIHTVGIVFEAYRVIKWTRCFLPCPVNVWCGVRHAPEGIVILVTTTSITSCVLTVAQDFGFESTLSNLVVIYLPVATLRATDQSVLTRAFGNF